MFSLIHGLNNAGINIEYYHYHDFQLHIIAKEDFFTVNIKSTANNLLHLKGLGKSPLGICLFGGSSYFPQWGNASHNLGGWVLEYICRCKKMHSPIHDSLLLFYVLHL